MIAPSPPAAAVPPAGASASGTSTDAAAEGADFGGLLTPATGAARPPADRDSRDFDPRGDESAGEPGLAERLLALIGASAAPVPVAVPGNGPSPSLTPAPPRTRADPLLLRAIPRPTSAMGVPLSGAAVATAPADAAMLPTAATAALADMAGTPLANSGSGASPAAAGSPPGGPGASLTALPPAPPLSHAEAAGTIVADAVKALGLTGAVADSGGGTSPGGDADVAGLTETAGLGERLTLPTAATTAPSRTAVAPAAGGETLAMPADPNAGFDDGFGARIGWLAEQRIGRAELRISPDHLGTIDVRLQIDGTRVSAEFQSAHAEVRQALEHSVGRLRDMLGQQGLQLAHADVGQGRGDGRGAPAPNHGDSGTGHEGAVEMPAPPPLLRSRGLLDEYA